MPTPTPMPTPSLTPIMDSTNTMPIANQQWNSKLEQYEITHDFKKFIKLTSPNVDPIIKKYFKNIHCPPITNIVDKNTNSTIKTSTKGADINEIDKACAIKNLTGSTCFFGVSMHYLYAMSYVRKELIRLSNSLNTELQYIVDLFKLMETKCTSPIGTDQWPLQKFKKIISKYLKNAVPLNIQEQGDNAVIQELMRSEHDSAEFISEILHDIQNSIYTNYLSQKYNIRYRTHKFDPISGADITNPVNGYDIWWKIESNTINKFNKKSTIEDLLYESYRTCEFLEGTNALVDPGDPTKYIFSYVHQEIVTLPPDLGIWINCWDEDKNKILVDYQINTTLKFNNNNNSKVYLLATIIIHIGVSIDHGHYTALVFNRRKTDGRLIYTYYNDSVSEQYILNKDSKIIDSHFYKKNPTDVPYLLFYN